VNGNLQRQERSTTHQHLPRKAFGVALIVFGLWVLSLSWGQLLLIAAALSVPTALVLIVLWRRSLPYRATTALTLLARGRDGERPRLRRLWRRGAVWHLAWRVPLGVTVSGLLRQREAIEQALDVSIEIWYDRRLVHMRAGTARLPKHVDFLDFYRRPSVKGELKIGVGTGREGALWVDLVQLPHLLVGGATGEGKTAFLRQVITGFVLSLQPEHLRLALVDLKGMEFGIFEQLPHMWGPVARELESALVLLQELGAELDRRQAAFADAGVQTLARWNEVRPLEALAYVLVVVDECAELSAAEVSDRDERARKQAALALISRFCRLGRASGIHVILCTQRPDADAVPGQLKANIPATVAFRVRGETNSRILLGEGNEAAAVLPPWPGRGIWQWDTQTQFQAPWLSPQQADLLLNAVRQPALVAGAESVPPRPIRTEDREALAS
jgi:hypothetical protein